MTSHITHPDADAFHGESEHVWTVNDITRPEKTVDLPSIFPSKTTSHKASANNLRIQTVAELDPHDHYISSEEEPSPSPDSDTASHLADSESEEDVLENEEENLGDDKENSTPADICTYDLQTETAVAIPIMALGRPKLIDIAKLAPMQKRKRASSDKSALTRSAIWNATSQATSRQPLKEMTNQSHASNITVASEPVEANTETPAAASPADQSREENTGVAIAEEDQAYFPNLDLRMPPTYSDYDPYSLSPPRLTPPAVREPLAKQPGSVARARRQANNRPSSARNLSLRSPARSLSLTKRLESSSPAPRQLNKKAKMLPRGATERTDVPYMSLLQGRSS